MKRPWTATTVKENIKKGDRIYSVKRRSRINATFGKKIFRNAAVTRGIPRKGNASFTIGYFEGTRLKPFEMCTINCRRDPPSDKAVKTPPVMQLKSRKNQNVSNFLRLRLWLHRLRSSENQIVGVGQKRKDKPITMHRRSHALWLV